MHIMKEELRKAYSTKEKTELLLTRLDKLKAVGSVSEAQYEELKAGYTKILEETLPELDSIKAKLQKELDGKTIELKWYKQELGILQSRLKVGEIPAKIYRERGKPLEKKVKRLEKEVSELSKLINSNCSADVGGPKNIKLPKLGREIMKKERIKHPSTEIDRSSSLLGKMREIVKRPSFLAAVSSACFLGLVIWIAIALINKPDEIPPTISNVSVLSITQSTAVVSWTTDEPATSWVTYRQLNSNETQTTSESQETLDIKHSVALRDLKPDTVYWLSIISKDASGNTANHDAGTIKTLQTPPTGPVIGNKVGNMAPDFTLPTIYGDNVTSSDFKGKIVMLNFWLYGCPHCETEMPYIQSIYNKWSRDKLVILAVNVRGDAANVKYLVEKKGLTFPILLDSEGKTCQIYYPPPREFPINFFIDAKGIIREIKAGEEGLLESPEEIENILKSL